MAGCLFALSAPPAYADLVIFADEPFSGTAALTGDVILTSEISQTSENSNVYSILNAIAGNETMADDAGDSVDFALAAAGAAIQAEGSAAGTRLTDSSHPTAWDIAGLGILIVAFTLWKRATLVSWKYHTAYRNEYSNRHW
jgi:hypothetical protein